MSRFKEYCVNNHLLSETRRISGSGKYFCIQCRVEYASKYSKIHRPRIRENNWKFKLKTQFNMTPQDYIDIYISQNGECAICKLHMEYRGLYSHIDHCHNTGNFRSILCHNCNTALGLLKENIEVMYRAIDYIEKHRAINIRSNNGQNDQGIS